MFARVTTFEVADGKETELVKAYGQAMELVKAQKGFQKGLLMIDESGKAVSVTLWDNKKNLESSGNPAPGDIIEKVVSIVRPYQKEAPRWNHLQVKLNIGFE